MVVIKKGKKEIRIWEATRSYAIEVLHNANYNYHPSRSSIIEIEKPNKAYFKIARRINSFLDNRNVFLSTIEYSQFNNLKLIEGKTYLNLYKNTLIRINSVVETLPRVVYNYNIFQCSHFSFTIALGTIGELKDFIATKEITTSEVFWGKLYNQIGSILLSAKDLIKK